MDVSTQKDIEKKMWLVLKDAGLVKPPIKIEDVITHLKLHLDFYSLEDPGFLKKLKHNFDIKTHRILETVKKSKIMAAWFPENSKILIDASLPERKKTFPKFHETVHSILPWHKEFYLGDTAETLSPFYQEELELEANYGASELWFCGPVFRDVSKDYSLEWKSIPILKDAFDTTLTTTLWKYVVSQETVPTIGIVSIPRWKWDGTSERCKYFIASPAFKKLFSKVGPNIIFPQIESKIRQCRGGPAGNYEISCLDDNGQLHSFRGESFFNSHELLTLIVHQNRNSTIYS